MPKLGLFASTSSLVTPSLSSVLGPLGFPLRLRITSSSLGFTANLLQTENSVDQLVYVGTNCYLLFAKTINGVTEIGINDDIYSNYPAWSAGATTIPRTGWQNNFVVSEAITTSVTITATTPQTFTYNASIPSISFSNNQSLPSNYFYFNPSLFLSSGTRTTTISLIEDANYVATNSPSVVYTINKKNVTIALTSQSSTYAPNQNYSASAPVAITSLSGADTILGSFASLLTGVPATGANAGSYTISFNPNYTSTNYNITNSPASVTWTISKANQTISFNPTLTGTNGQTQNLSASSTSGLSVSLSVVSGPATLNGSTLTYTGVGNVVVRASQAGNTNYNPASDVDRTIVVSAPSNQGAGFPPSIRLNQTRYSSAQTYTLVKKSTSLEFLGQSSGSGDTFYLGTGVIYKNINIGFGGEDYGSIYLVTPNSSVLDTPSLGSYAWVQTPIYYNSHQWAVVNFFLNDGTQREDLATNSSASTTSIPLNGWGSFGDGVSALSFTSLWISTASAQTIYLTSSETAYGITSEYYGGGNYYEGSGDWKLVWSGTRWEIRGDNNSLAYYSLASGQSADWFPREQSWFILSNSQTITLTFTD